MKEWRGGGSGEEERRGIGVVGRGVEGRGERKEEEEGGGEREEERR